MGFVVYAPQSAPIPTSHVPCPMSEVVNNTRSFVEKFTVIHTEMLTRC
jgi:hypothetical protein